MTIFTIGHSTRDFDELIEILRAHGVQAIADVRLIPRSRRYPHFNDEALKHELPKNGIAYLPFKSLGGRKRPMLHSPNTGWRNASFQGYADFMQTPDFEAALNDLIQAAAKQPTTIMCAEAVPWRCHRSLIADALLVRGWRVMDIFDAKKATEHELTKFAKVEDTRITYPPEQPQLFPVD